MEDEKEDGAPCCSDSGEHQRKGSCLGDRPDGQAPVTATQGEEEETHDEDTSESLCIEGGKDGEESPTCSPTQHFEIESNIGSGKALESPTFSPGATFDTTGG